MLTQRFEKLTLEERQWGCPTTILAPEVPVKSRTPRWHWRRIKNAIQRNSKPRYYAFIAEYQRIGSQPPSVEGFLRRTLIREFLVKIRRMLSIRHPDTNLDHLDMVREHCQEKSFQAETKAFSINPKGAVKRADSGRLLIQELTTVTSRPASLIAQYVGSSTFGNMEFLKDGLVRGWLSGARGSLIRFKAMLLNLMGLSDPGDIRYMTASRLLASYKKAANHFIHRKWKVPETFSRVNPEKNPLLLKGLIMGPEREYSFRIVHKVVDLRDRVSLCTEKKQDKFETTYYHESNKKRKVIRVWRSKPSSARKHPKTGWFSHSPTDNLSWR